MILASAGEKEEQTPSQLAVRSGRCRQKEQQLR